MQGNFFCLHNTAQIYVYVANPRVFFNMFHRNVSEHEFRLLFMDEWQHCAFFKPKST